MCKQLLSMEQLVAFGKEMQLTSGSPYTTTLKVFRLTRKPSYFFTFLFPIRRLPSMSTLVGSLQLKRQAECAPKRLILIKISPLQPEPNSGCLYIIFEISLISLFIFFMIF